MKVFVVLFAMVAAVCAAGTINLSADQKLDESVFDRYSLNHMTLRYGPSSILPQPGFKNAIDDKIIAYLENAREHFEEGWPDKGIPPLEPVKLDHFHTNVHEVLVVNVDFDMDDISIAGLKGFEIDVFNFKVVGLTVDFKFHIPKIVYNSKYSITGTVASLIHVCPHGDAHAEIDGLVITGAATLGTTDGYLYIKAFQTTFDFDKFKASLSGILGDGIVNSLFNWVLSEISDSVIQGQKENIENKASEFILEIANSMLKNVTLSDIIG